MVNFAHGDVFMVGSFIALIALLVLGVSAAMPIAMLVAVLILVILITMTLTSVWGWTVERIAYRPLRGSFRLAPLITAIGMSITLQNFVQLVQGAQVKALPSIASGGYALFGTDRFMVRISNIQIIIIGVTALLTIGLALLISRTAIGRSQRACEQDVRMAALLGVNVDHTISLTFVIGAALAAVGGVMYLLYYGVIDFYIGFGIGIKAFTAAVLGGIGSFPGAVLGGLLLGLIETYWSAYFSVEYKDVAAFSILIVTLIFLPSGLLGRPEVEKV